MAIKLSRHQCQHFAFSYHYIDREKLSYKSVSRSKDMAGMVMAIPIICVFYWTSQSHFQGACNIHAHSDLVELCSLVSTGEHGLL